jgi:vesicle coat complex subunit
MSLSSLTTIIYDNNIGENFELKAELNSEYRHVRKDAVKKVIANMTVGKDVSGLFPDVLKNMQTEDLELKKLVYLYLMNYAKSQPELVILAVNTFVKDSDDPNPLIRALAIRTMGCLRVDKIIDYLTEPLRNCLKVNPRAEYSIMVSHSLFVSIYLPTRMKTHTYGKQQLCVLPSYTN